MQEFEYRAIDSSGQILKGEISATDLIQAKKIIREKGLILLEVKKKEISRDQWRLISFIPKGKIDDKEIYSLFRELAILLRSGLTLDRALTILIETASNDYLKTALNKIQKTIREGQSVSQAFIEAKFLPPLMLSMISAGEAIGKLSLAFENISDYYQFKINLKNEIKSALAYPIFLVIASIITVFIVFRFILPRFFSLFADINLPLPAKLLYTLSQFLSKINLYVIFLFFLVIWLFTKTNIWKISKDKLVQQLIRFPVLQKFIRELDLARFSHSMYSMLKSGIDFVDALYLSKNVVINKNLQSFLEYAILEIKKGNSISDTFKNIPFFSLVYYNMLKVGEESGNLQEIFFELYNMHEDNFRNNIKRLLILLEPTIVTFTGLLIGFIVIALILTVMNISIIKF